MTDYFSPTDLDMSIEERKWLFKIRTDHIDLPSNRRWMKEAMNCSNCLHTEINQRHLLNCKYLLGKSKLVTYIEDFSVIYNGTLEEMVYRSRVIRDNFMKLNTKGTM